VLGTSSRGQAARVPSAPAVLQSYREIGEITDHDTRVLFLDLEYGYPLMYHAEVSGDTWPGSDDLNAEALDGRPIIDANKRFARDYEGFKPNYFVITDLDSLDAQPDLQALLNQRATLIHKAPRYRVYKFNS
jgi:hypothetical protein